MRQNSLKTILKAGLLAFAAFAGASCTRETFTGVAKGSYEVSVSVSMNETKTVNEGMSTLWAADDALSLLVYPLDGTGYENVRFKYSGNNQFKGRIEDPGSMNSFYAVYPYSKDIKSPRNLSINVGKTLVQEGNNSTDHLAGENFPLYGKMLNVPWGTSIAISMQNILSVARFKVTNATESPIVVKSIEFTSSNYITGPFAGDITNDEPVWNSKEGASTKVVLTVNNGTEIAAGENASFYAGILPNVCAAGSKLKLKVTASTGSEDVVFYRLFELTQTYYFFSSYMKDVNCSFDAEHSQDPWPESEEQAPVESEKYYYKLTSTPASWEGTYLIVDETESAAFAENKDSYRTPVEIVDGKIEAKPALAECQVTVSTSEAGAGKYDLKTIQGNYLYYYKGAFLFDTAVANSNTYYNLLSISGGKVTAASTYGQNQMRFGFEAGKFGYFNDESSAWDEGVSFYRLGKSSQGGDTPGGDDPTQDPTKEDQTISFSSETVSWTLGDSYQVGGSYSLPSVSGAKTEVTYTSSNPNVATIEEGKIVILAAGTTVIKATAAETDTVNGATASFTLTIKSEGQPTSSSYVKVTSEPTSWDGTYLVVDESAGMAFAPFTANESTYAVSVTINNGTIASDEFIDAYAITVTGTGNKHENDNVSSLKAYNVKNSEGNYIWWSSNFGAYDSAKLINNSTNTAENSSTTYEYYHTFKYDGGVQMASAINTSGGTAYYLAYSSSKFAYSSDNSSKRVQLYKLTGGQSGEQQTQTLSFAKSSINWTLSDGVCEVGETYSVQSLTGTYYTAVTYTSSNPDVATIVNGNIMVQGTGTTTITATAAASSSYKSATATYTLTINPAGSGSTTTAGYELLTSAPSDWSGSYLLVNIDKSYVFNGQTSSSNKVSLSSSDFSGNIITNSSLSQYAFTISKSGEKFYFKKGDNYYSVSYSSNSSTGIVTSTSSSDAGWSYEGIYSSTGGFLFSHPKSSSDSEAQYIYFKTSDGNFKFGHSGETVGILLYKLNDGTISGGDTPDTPDTPTTGDYFVKVTSNPSSWEGTYLVVDESAGKAFAYNSSSSYATSVTISNSKIAYSSALDEIALRVSDAGLDHANTQIASDLGTSSTLRAYNVKTKDGKYIYASQSSVKVADSNTGSNGGGNSTSYYHAFYYNSGVYMVSSGNYGSSSSSQSYYYSLSYSSSAFAYNQGKSKLAKCQLYKLNGESGGGTVDPGTDDPDPVDPTPSGTSFNLENSTLTSYLDDVATSYTNSNYSTSVVKSYTGTSAKLDFPNPVSLSWSGSATSIDIYEGTSTSGTAVKSMSFSSSTSVDVYNLIPGKNYSFKTSNGQTGTFNTTGRRRMIKVSENASANHARNCRDLGGIETANGQKLKYGLLFRGTNMDDVTTEEKAILRNELGIKLDVDLRGGGSSSGYGGWGGQSGKSESPLGSDISISNKAYSSGSMTGSSAETNLKTTVPDILNSVIDGKPVYIHCYIGSDRTGYVCMLIEALLGVSKKECDIDYELTSFASGIVGGVRNKEYTDNQDFREKFVVSPYSADSVPESVENYVVNTLGVSLDTVKKFRKAMGVNETL